MKFYQYLHKENADLVDYKALNIKHKENGLIDCGMNMVDYKDLKVRSLTALALTFVTFISIILGAEAFFLYMGTLILICAYEWAKLSGLSVKSSVIVCVSILGVFLIMFKEEASLLHGLYIVSAVSLIFSFFYRQLYVFAGILYFVSVLMSLLLVVVSATLLFGPYWFLVPMLLWLGVAVTDVSAYLIGRKFGKTKLAPNISPNKSVEGLIGACIFTGLYFIVLILCFNSQLSLFISMASISLAFVLGACAALFAQMGDLYQSKMKRIAGVKDSGIILPGHGGMFDRLDGLMTVLFVCGILIVLIGLILG